MYSISLAEIKILNDFKNIILDDKNSLDTIIKECNRISPLIDDIYFPYVYSATLLAAEGKIENSIRLYDFCQNNAFAQIVKKYLEEYGCLMPKVKVFKDNAPYTAWTKTNFAKNYIKNSGDVIANFYLNRFKQKQNEITILDIGTGNGVLITEIVNKIIEKTDVKYVNLILLDQSGNMLATAEKHCNSNINAELKITNICCKINEINEEQLSIIKSRLPVSFVNCALSIHHFPWEVKLQVLKLLKSLSPFCFISEVNWNHDIPEKYSPELIYSVSINMHYIFSNVMESNITDNEKKLAIENFFLAESINIIRQDRDSRIDYHTKIREWVKLANTAGYKVNKIIPTIIHNNRIAIFTMILADI